MVVFWSANHVDRIWPFMFSKWIPTGNLFTLLLIYHPKHRIFENVGNVTSVIELETDEKDE